jgi:hypothetical protein
MNKDLKMVHNVLQCLLFNSSRFHYLIPLRKRVIAKMAYLVEFWLILESENCTHNNTDFNLTNKFVSNEFGSVMKNL